MSLVFWFVFFSSSQLKAQHDHGSHDHGSKFEKPEEKIKNGVTDIIMVYGNCGMCKKRIEGALANTNGVHSADWDVNTKVLTVKHDNEIISKNEIKKKVAEAGHDTDMFRAKQKVYDKLPGCCQYDRPTN